MTAHRHTDPHPPSYRPGPATRRAFLGRLAQGAAGLGVLTGAVPGLTVGPARVSAAGAVTGRPAGPAPLDRPVHPADAPAEEASFIDPTARIDGPDRVTVGRRVYVGPFAWLDAGNAPIVVGDESNVQDNVTVRSSRSRRRSERGTIAALGLDADAGIETGRRCILAHGSRVIGPARLGLEGFDADPVHDVGVFLSFGAEVDGAIIEQKCAVSALARVGPGVRLRSGTVVLPGRNVVTQADADDPGRGKVRRAGPGDVAFKEAVVEVNTSLARSYTLLYRDDPTAVTGINLDPGGTTFNPERDTPVLAGRPARRPRFRNRVIGAVTLADRFDQLDEAMDEAISLRADEGEPISVGHVAAMHRGVTFHALEETAITVGDGVRFGPGAIVHGGARSRDGVVVEQATVIGAGATLGAGSVVFRSRVGPGARIGVRSAVINSELPAGAVVPDGTVIQDDVTFGPVEWGG